MKDFEYKYKAVVTSIYDADSLRVTLDLGLDIKYERFNIRLARINAPEIRGEERPAGLIARDRLRELILNKEVIIHTFKDKKGKYGRYIADIILPNGAIVNDILVAEGHAVYRDY